MRRVRLPVTLAAVWLALSMPTSVATAPRRAPVSSDLHAHQQLRPAQTTRVIVHGDRAMLLAAAARAGARVLRLLDHEIVVEANGAQIDALAGDAAVEHLSGDVAVRSAAVIAEPATAVDFPDVETSALVGVLTGVGGVTGEGVGIAVLDSGISPHAALGARVATNVSVVAENPATADEFGHGTHVAGLIAGTGTAARSVTEAYAGGIAPGAHLVNVRVLRGDGTGLTSDVIAGIDWVIANKSKYNIGVINVALGHPVTEPAATDPLCEAAARATRAGIVVVTAAGNRGKTGDGNRILGGVTSPGNSPYAVTIGALNTRNTVSRSDDSVTTYSSRGPTRFDVAVKPDLVAPGNNLVSLDVPGSHIARAHAHTHVAGSGANSYMRLSGTSLATAVVSGSVALMLQRRPDLSPYHVKLLLQVGSLFLPDEGLVAAGAGSLDVASSLPLIDGRGSRAGIAYSDAGNMIQRLYDGNGVMPVGLAEVGAALRTRARLAWDTLHLVGEHNPLGQVSAKSIVWGNVGYWTDSSYIRWGQTLRTPEGQYLVWGDAPTTESDEVVSADEVLPRVPADRQASGARLP